MKHLRALYHAIGLTLVCWAVLGVAGAALAVGLTARLPGLAIIAALVLALWLATYLASLAPLKVSATRSGVPQRVGMGRKIPVRLTIRARRSRASLTLIEDLPASVNRRLVIPLSGIVGGAERQVSYEFFADARGPFPVGPLWAQAKDPFGFTSRTRLICPATEMVIYPVVESAPDVISSRAWEDPVMRPPHSRPWPTGAEFYGYRPYQAGDDPRQINWRAYAQHETYLVREAEHGITSLTHVVIDTNAASYGADSAPGALPAPGVRLPRFECALRIAASVVLGHLSNDQEVSLALGGTRLELTRSVRDRFAALDALARAGVDHTPASRHLWELVRGSAYGHVVLVTGALGTEDVRLINMLCARRASVTVALAVGPDTPATTFDAMTGLRARVVMTEIDTSVFRSFSRPLAGAR